MTAGSSALRAAAALAAGAFAVHQLRYAFGYGDAAGPTLDAHGHGYLTLVTPVVALLLSVAGGQFLAILARARGATADGASPRSERLVRLWLAATLALAATYTGQELVEGALSSGHPGGVAAVLAGGGWWALPLSAAMGLAVALLLRGADAAIARAARQTPARERPARPVQPAPRSVDLPSPGVLGRNLAGRAPPVAAVRP